MLRKIIVFLAASSLSLLLLLTTLTATIVLVLTPANLKTWLSKSTVYETFVDDLLAQSKTFNKSSDGKNPLDDPGVQAAAKKTFTPKFLQSTAEGVINGTSPWLEGKASKPQFSIDLSQAKVQFADNIGAYAAQRYAALPACAAGQVPQSVDALTVSCKPAGYDATVDINKTVNDLKTSKDFLGTTTINQDDLKSSAAGSSATQPLYQQWSKAPQYYQWAHQVPVVLGVLVLLTMFIIIFVSQDRRRGLRKVASTLIVFAFVCLFEVFVVNFGVQKLQTQVQKQATDNPGLGRTAVSLLQVVQQDLNRVIGIFAGVYLLTGLAIYLYLVITRPKNIVESSALQSSAKNHLLEEDQGPSPVEEALQQTSKPEIKVVKPSKSSRPKDL